MAAAASAAASSFGRFAAGAVVFVPPSRAAPREGSSRSIPARSSQIRTWEHHVENGDPEPRQNQQRVLRVEKPIVLDDASNSAAHQIRHSLHLR